MSILIKGVDMPKSCKECRWSSGSLYDDRRYCDLVGAGIAVNLTEGGRAVECPLIELPPHGRLVDENELIKRAHIEAEGLENITPETFSAIIEWLAGKCNTVIESEE